MKRLLVISYWVLSLLLVAIVVSSLGYTFLESFFIGTLFLPGALASRYFFPKVNFKDRRSGIKDTVFIVLGILSAEFLLFMIALIYLDLLGAARLEPAETIRNIPMILANPVFIALILTILATGSYFFETWLDKKRPTPPAPIKFTSERKPVTLSVEEILYVESNDDVTIVYATEGRCYRNITPISRWEAILAPRFLRIHRSYLVNKAAVTGVDVDLLYIGETQLPISRKYREEVLGLYS